MARESRLKGQIREHFLLPHLLFLHENSLPEQRSESAFTESLV